MPTQAATIIKQNLRKKEKPINLKNKHGKHSGSAKHSIQQQATAKKENKNKKHK